MPTDRAASPIVVSYSFLDPHDTFLWCDPKRYAPNRGEWLLRPANSQDCDASKVQSHPTRNVPLPQVCLQPGRETKHDSEQGLMRRKVIQLFLLMRSLPPSSPSQEAISPRCHWVRA